MVRKVKNDFKVLGWGDKESGVREGVEIGTLEEKWFVRKGFKDFGLGFRVFFDFFLVFLVVVELFSKGRG